MYAPGLRRRDVPCSKVVALVAVSGGDGWKRPGQKLAPTFILYGHLALARGEMKWKYARRSAITGFGG